jgi:hypothetical protein
MGYVLLKYSPDFNLTLTILDGLNTTVKMIVDFCMYWQFLKVLRYFVNVKKERSKELFIEFTLFNKFVVCWTLFLWLLCVYQSITTIHGFFLRVYSKNYLEDPVLLYYSLFLFFIVFPIRDFFIASSFAYLYYYQGLKNKKKEVVVDEEADAQRDLNTRYVKDLLNRR